MTDERVTISSFGDAAVLVAVAGGDLAGRAARSAALADDLPAHLGGTAWGRPVPGVGGVLVPFDPVALGVEQALARVASALPVAGVGIEPRRSGRTIDVPVRYGGAEGPDLESVAAALGIAPDEVVRLHTEHDYAVLVLGFLPGFAYLGPLPPPLARLPRRGTPRPRIEAGSVAVAAGMTGIYPSASPGGWHVIGRTDLELWQPSRVPPNRLARGDRVRFVPARDPG